MKNKHEQLKVLFIDIETSPLLVYSWGLGDQHLSIDQIVKDWNILSIAAKWEHEKKVLQWDIRQGITEENEKKLIANIVELLDEADVVIGQNSRSFDVKKINEKILYYGLPIPSPYQQIDTYVESKKNFLPTSHKLEYRSKQLNKNVKKSSHSKFPGLSLWRACLNGVKDAWKEMADYNVKDVLSTEEYYNRIKPWIKTVNFNILNSNISCPRCQSTSIQLRGKYVTKTAIYQRVHCQKCGSWSRTKTNLKPTKVNKAQLIAL